MRAVYTVSRGLMGTHGVPFVRMSPEYPYTVSRRPNQWGCGPFLPRFAPRMGVFAKESRFFAGNFQILVYPPVGEGHFWLKNGTSFMYTDSIWVDFG